MKILYFLLFLSSICIAQINDEFSSISKSRNNAEKVFKLFNNENHKIILYSLEDKYFYLIIETEKKDFYKEYYIALDDLDSVNEVRFINNIKQTRKQRKDKKKSNKLLSEAEPIFDLKKYHTNLITKVPNAEFVRGVPSYFVLKDINNEKYGEYQLASLTLPLPINGKLAGYLIKRLSEEINRKE
ncbi:MULTISPECIES: hypothetical protein [Empedobacter]|uniref:hypothetical protein n=1 Tax=Empedobacter TaxID=59734 RepID=UPI002447C4EC|nr:MULTISPECIES: hypothetical protein [Empedobacter]MDH0675794.1 hypothetical protein [Empedobacter sp. GD03861]